MAETPEPVGKIYALMPQVMRDIGVVPQLGKMTHGDNYKYHRLKDILAFVHAAMVKHEVFVVPRVLERSLGNRTTKSGTVYKVVYLKVEYRFYTTDGSYVETIVEAEGEDNGDKATSKAMSFAYKAALIQAFSIPAEDLVDGDDERGEESVTGQGGEKRRNLRAVESNDKKAQPAAAAGQAAEAAGKKTETKQEPETDDEVEAALKKAFAVLKVTTEDGERRLVAEYLKVKDPRPVKDLNPGERRAFLAKLRKAASGAKSKQSNTQASAP